MSFMTLVFTDAISLPSLNHLSSFKMLFKQNLFHDRLSKLSPTLKWAGPYNMFPESSLYTFKIEQINQFIVCCKSVSHYTKKGQGFF